MSKRKSPNKSKPATKSPNAKGRVPRGTAPTVRRASQTPLNARQSASPKQTGGRHDIELIARGCLLHGSHVLLCRNVKHGYCYLPGGHVEFGESAAEALAREFLEECGLRVTVGDLALASEGAFATKKRWHHEVNLVFHVEHAAKPGRAGAGQPKVPTSTSPPPIKSREEGIDFIWVELAAVPETDIRPVAAKAWLATLGGISAAGAEWISEIPAN